MNSLVKDSVGMDRYFLLKYLWKKHGIRSLFKQFRLSYYRPVSRRWIKRFAPHGQGIEIGVGAQTIAPIGRTRLTDGFSSHAKDSSLAKEFFSADKIPYPDQSFQFLLSEHVLEHLPNVIQVLKEWRRVLRPGGVIFLFLPHPDRTFDRGRPITSLSHLLDEEYDWQKNETSHYEEWNKNVLSVGLAPQYANLSPEQCLTTNSIHRHVWTESAISELLESLGFEILLSDSKVPDRLDSFVVIAKK